VDTRPGNFLIIHIPSRRLHVQTKSACPADRCAVSQKKIPSELHVERLEDVRVEKAPMGAMKN